MRKTLFSLALVAGAAQAADFGMHVEKELRARSMPLFGVGKPLAESASTPAGFARRSGQGADAQVLLAEGLAVRYLTRQAAHNTDQMVPWPSAAAPTHLVTCVEEFARQVIGTFAGGVDKYNPSVQTIELSSGAVRTVLRGMAGCDGLRRTPWGTLLVTEEITNGQAFEILDPLAFENLTLIRRGSPALFDQTGADVTDTTHTLALRAALPTMAWEGLGILPSGVVYAGDELRPGTTGPDTDGGAIFKFLPAVRHDGGPVVNLDQSPLTAGALYAMQVTCRADRQQHGQGCEVGAADWVAINPANARTAAAGAGATGYYRPEDLELDPDYTGPGARFCVSNTQAADAGSFGEVVCVTDIDPFVVGVPNGEPRPTRVTRFITGNEDLNQPDNLAFQPDTGRLYVIEDNPNGDVWACLPDGADRDAMSDGCVKVLSVVDDSTEPTGLLFAPDGRSAYLSIQHSADPADGSMDRDDYGTDDVLHVTGFKPPAP